MPRKLFVAAILTFLANTGLNANHASIPPCDRICGKWMSAKKNCIVQVFKDDDDFKAKLVWFDDSDDPSIPMQTRLDIKNPDHSLRNRKLIGMDVLENLEYKPRTDSWENGIIYDAQTGKKWNAAARLMPNGILKVTGYWHFKFIGRSMDFYRVL